MALYNSRRSIYQYSNMALRLSGQTSIFGVVFFVSKSLLGIERQKKLEKFAILTRKPRSHVRILIYQTWPIEVHGTVPISFWRALQSNSRKCDRLKYVWNVCCIAGTNQSWVRSSTTENKETCRVSISHGKTLLNFKRTQNRSSISVIQ